MAKGLIAEIREAALKGLNAGSGDGEWEALVNIGDLVGLTYNEDKEAYEYE